MSTLPIPSTVSTALLETLQSLGVNHIFTVPGAQISSFLKSLEHHDHILPIVATHELSAAYMACGAARATGTLGVVASIGGPGAAYMLAAAQVARANQLPVCFITGDIPRKAHGLDEFQDAGPAGTNDLRVFSEAISTSMLCGGPEDLPQVVQQLRASLESRRPLHIKIPIDVQMMPCEHIPQKKALPLPSLNIGTIKPDIDAPERVVIFAGGGIMDLVDPSQLLEYVRTRKIGVVTDYGTRGMVPEDAIESLGMVGFRSDPRALLALRGSEALRAEKVICVGVPENTICRYIDVATEREVVSVDDFRSLLQRDTSVDLPADRYDRRQAWLGQLAAHRLFPAVQHLDIDQPVTYRQLFSRLTALMPPETRYCLDAGQARLAGSMLLSCHEPKMISQSEALSPMGYGLCSAIGMQLAAPDRPVVVVVGDGSMRMLGMELATAVRYSLGVIFVLTDNQSYASTKSWDLGSDFIQLPAMDWSRFAASIGIECLKVQTTEEFSNALNHCVSVAGPTLIWIPIEGSLDSFFTTKHELEYPTWLSKLKKSIKES